MRERENFLQYGTCVYTLIYAYEREREREREIERERERLQIIKVIALSSECKSINSIPFNAWWFDGFIYACVLSLYSLHLC